MFLCIPRRDRDHFFYFMAATNEAVRIRQGVNAIDQQRNVYKRRRFIYNSPGRYWLCPVLSLTIYGRPDQVGILTTPQNRQ